MFSAWSINSTNEVAWDIRAKYSFFTDCMKLTIALHNVLPHSQCLFSNSHHPSCHVYASWSRDHCYRSAFLRDSSTPTLPLHLVLFINAETFNYCCLHVRSLFAGCSCARPSIQAVHVPKHLVKWTFHHLVMCFPMKAKWLNDSKKLRSYPILQTWMASKTARYQTSLYTFLPCSQFVLDLMHLAGCQCLLDWRLALLVFVALPRSFRVSGVHMDCSQQANGEASSLTLSRTRAVLSCSFLLFFKFRKMILAYFFLFSSRARAAVYLRSILGFSLFSFGAHERLCCFHFLHFLSTNTPRKIPTNRPKTPRLAGSNSCFCSEAVKNGNCFQQPPSLSLCLFSTYFRQFQWWTHSSLQPYWTALKRSTVTPKFNPSAQCTLVSDHTNIVSSLREPGWSNQRGGA